MLFPAKMYKTIIVTPKKNRQKVINKLRGYVQLEEYDLKETRKLLPDTEKIDQTLNKLEQLIEQLKPKGKAEKSHAPILEAEEISIEAGTKLDNLNQTKEKINHQSKKLQTMLRMIDTERFIGIIQVFTETQEEWDSDREKLKEKGGEIISTRIFEDQVIVLAKETEKGMNGNYSLVRQQITDKLEELNSELKEIEERKQEIREEYGPQINRLKEQVETERKVIEEKKKITHSELFSFLQGWVPEQYTDRVEALDDSMIFLEEAGEDAPTKLDNPWFFKPFENFMYLFALPRYGEFDPTPLISIFFPLFYGVMLSDAGYGMLLLLVSLATRRKFRVMSELLLISAISTILFGVFFDSYFGVSLGRRIVSPIQEPFQLVYYSIVFGVFYVDLGLVMGMIQNLLKDDYYEALTQQISLLIFQFGIAMFLLHVHGGIMMMIVGLGLKVWADNIRGFLEIPSFMSSIISFSRLAALALATAWISFTINFLAGLLVSLHGVGIIPAVILAIAGHLFNFTFNAFGAFIHALRLHYVEFMGLFFTAKGKPFTPLGE